MATTSARPPTSSTYLQCCLPSRWSAARAASSPCLSAMATATHRGAGTLLPAQVTTASCSPVICALICVQSVGRQPMPCMAWLCCPPATCGYSKHSLILQSIQICLRITRNLVWHRHSVIHVWYKRHCGERFLCTSHMGLYDLSSMSLPPLPQPMSAPHPYTAS